MSTEYLRSGSLLLSEPFLQDPLFGRAVILVCHYDEDGAFGRSMADAPEIDGCVFLNGDTEVKVGDIVSVKIKHTDEYDMWGIRE